MMRKIFWINKNVVYLTKLFETRYMPAGRPTKYDESFNEQAYKLCLLGFTDIELANFFEVVEDTINEWKNVYPEFSVSVKRGKDIADAEVAVSFHKRAVGYTYEEETFEGGELTKTVVKEMAPDPGSALNWLKNRQPKKWRDKQEIGLSGGITFDVKLNL